MGRLIEELASLPGIGRKSAERLAWHILRMPKEKALRLAGAIRDVKQKVRPCSICFQETDRQTCSICSNPKRDRKLICVVENSNDVRAIEKTGRFEGLYHVLRGHISPLDGIGPQQLTIAALLERIKGTGVREVILALNPTMEGDATAMFLAKEISRLGVRVTRLARGIPTGGTLEYASTAMLSDALNGRRPVEGA